MTDNVVDLDHVRTKKMLAAIHATMDRVVNQETVALAIIEVHPVEDAVTTVAILNRYYHQVLSGAVRLTHQLACQDNDDETEEI